MDETIIALNYIYDNLPKSRDKIFCNLFMKKIKDIDVCKYMIENGYLDHVIFCDNSKYDKYLKLIFNNKKIFTIVINFNMMSNYVLKYFIKCSELLPGFEKDKYLKLIFHNYYKSSATKFIRFVIENFDVREYNFLYSYLLCEWCDDYEIFISLLMHVKGSKFKFNYDNIVNTICNHNNVEIMEHILNIYTYCEYDIFYDKLLFKANIAKKFDIIKVIIENIKLNDNFYSNRGYDKLIDIIFKNNCIEIVKYMLDEYNYGDYEYFYNKLLCEASSNGNYDIIVLLLENIENIDIHFDDNYSIKCAAQNSWWNIVDLLLDLHKQDELIHSGNEYVFRMVCKNGNLELAQKLKYRYPSIDHHVKNNWCYKNTKDVIIHKWLENECIMVPNTKSSRKIVNCKDY